MNQKRKVNSRLQKYIFILLSGIIFGIIIFFVLNSMKTQEAQVDKSSTNTPKKPSFSISEGESARSIASRLFDGGFIRSKEKFLFYANQSRDASKYQAGDFEISKEMSIPELSETLTLAIVGQISVTIPEGFTNKEIDERLSEKKLIEQGEFLDCVRNCDFSDFPFLPFDAELREGFFFPDTYFIIPSKFNTENFAHQLLSTFHEKTKEIFEQSERNPNDIVKMASIIEKEGISADERPIISDIFWKRLDAGWTLGSDATTRYAVDKKTETLTEEDFQNSSPWNTRVVKGLPPGAICNPGLSSLQAAAKPAQTNSWYFIHDSNKKIYYAETIEEHDENRKQYLLPNMGK